MSGKTGFLGRLYFRFLFVFGLLCSVLVVVIGLVFTDMYKNNVISEYVDYLESDSIQIADRIEEYVIEDDTSGYSDYMAAIESVLSSQMVDVWVLPYNKATDKLKTKYVNVSMRYKDLSKGMKKVMKVVFSQDKTMSNQGYDEIYETELIRAASPIHDSGGNVIGGVLLNGVSSSRVETIASGRRIVIISLVIAWIAAFIIALFFARPLTRPISRIGKTATLLAEGQYSVKTDIKNSGEIGELAETIDILSDKLAENERVRQEIEQGRLDFFANVSHELRTPITVIRGYTESLSDGYITDPEKIQHTYERMLAECRGIERLVGDLLTLSKMQNPDFVIEKEPVSVVQVFEDVTRNAKLLSDSRNIEINFSTNDEYGFMMGDYDRIRQMFMVIIDNAIKFSKDNSSIDIVLRKEDKLRISITDYGVGIPAEALPNIFAKFYRSKLQMNEKGSGLGLPIARNIAIKHGGTLTVESTEGKGTTFTFEFDSIEMPEDV